MKSIDKARAIKALKTMRRDNFTDKSEFQTLRRDDSRYNEVIEVHKKATDLLKKETGR